MPMRTGGCAMMYCKPLKMTREHSLSNAIAKTRWVNMVNKADDLLHMKVNKVINVKDWSFLLTPDILVYPSGSRIMPSFNINGISTTAENKHQNLERSNLLKVQLRMRL